MVIFNSLCDDSPNSRLDVNTLCHCFWERPIISSWLDTMQSSHDEGLLKMVFVYILDQKVWRNTVNNTLKYQLTCSCICNLRSPHCNFW